MRIAVLSDTRLPSRLDYPGHGLGKAMAKIAMGLAGRGHDVTLFAGFGSSAPGCVCVCGPDEGEMAEHLLEAGPQFDAYLDGSHYHRLAATGEGWPVVCRAGDMECRPPRQAIYNSRALAEHYEDGIGQVIYNGYDLADIPYNGGQREDQVLFVGWLHAPTKRPEVGAEIAARLRRPYFLVGPGGWQGQGQHLGALTYGQTLWQMGMAWALVAPGTFNANLNVISEANATGTPVLALRNGREVEAMQDGVTGFARETVDELVATATSLETIRPADCRAWVAAHRSFAQMIDGWEQALMRVADGERW